MALLPVAEAMADLVGAMVLLAVVVTDHLAVVVTDHLVVVAMADLVVAMADLVVVAMVLLVPPMVLLMVSATLVPAVEAKVLFLLEAQILPNSTRRPKLLLIRRSSWLLFLSLPRKLLFPPTVNVFLTAAQVLPMVDPVPLRLLVLAMVALVQLMVALALVQLTVALALVQPMVAPVLQRLFVLPTADLLLAPMVALVQ